MSYSCFMLASLNLFLCLHLLTNSSRLFKHFVGAAISMCLFSAVQSPQNLLLGLYLGTFSRIDHLIEYSSPLSFKLHRYSDKSVHVLYLSYLEFVLCWYQRALKVLSAIPI